MQDKRKGADGKNNPFCALCFLHYPVSRYGAGVRRLMKTQDVTSDGARLKVGSACHVTLTARKLQLPLGAFLDAAHETWNVPPAPVMVVAVHGTVPLGA